MHIRLREGVFLNRIVQLLDQAMNIDCDLLGMAGFFKVERLVEKRLSRSPERGAAAMLNDGKSDIPLLLRPENFPTFFTSQLPAIPTLSPYVATCGLVYRNQTGTPRAKQLERLFYRSPLSAGSGTHIQYHVHGLLLPDEGLEGCPDEHELSRIGGQGKGLMATHLEDQTLISECQIGIYCLKLDK
jgi:hypothetical protein